MLGKTLFGGLLVAVLASCGGGGSREFETGPVSGGGTTPVASVPASMELTRSAPTVSSDGRQTVRLIATVKDSGNVAMAAVPVTFAASGTGVLIAVARGQTDANGRAEATISVTDPVNRTVEVTASAGGRTAVTTIDIVGSSASISGPVSVVVNTPAVFRVLVRDASGVPIVGKAVQATSAAGNPVNVPSATTDSQGAVDLILTPSRIGTDTLTVSAAGATGARALQVSATSVAFDAPAAASEIVVSSPAVPVRVRVLENGAPPPVPVAVGFTTTRGVLGAASSLTDASGYATTTIRSDLAGRSLITATSPTGAVSTREVLFVGNRAAKLEVQASPSTLGVNLSGNSTESSQIIGVVRDLADNPVKGARVNFTVVDPSAGAGLSQSFAITDDSGRASVTFYPGALPTGANKIVVIATVECGFAVSGVQCADSTQPATDQILLTASRRALQVRIGTGNELVKVEEQGSAPVFNEMPYGVLVTDSAGNPVSGVTLNATVVSLRYLKGFWAAIAQCNQGLEPCWRQVVDGVCQGEDANENLLLERSEDANGDGLLTPGNVGAAFFGASGLSTTAVTDDKGSSVLRMRYLRDRSRWVDVRLRITASVPDGTEGAETVEFRLPILASDVVSPAVSPPGATSPYGTGVCP